jgi:hypothetical protein
MSRRVWAILAVAALIAAGLAFAGYRWWAQRYTVTVEEDGAAVTQVVVATLRGTSALKVATVSGVVQSSAADTRLGGLLSSDQIIKAPFSVDYMLDLRGLRPGDLRWDPAARRLTIDAPDVTVAAPNVDEARRTLVRTRGLFVTRGAAEELQRRTALGAERAARAEANRPERVRQARDHARRALERLLSAPLSAAGLRVASVEVRFPDERNRSREQWDMSRPPAEIIRQP